MEERPKTDSPGTDRGAGEHPAGPIRLLAVIPGEPDPVSFIFARRELAHLEELGVACETFFLPYDKGLRGFREKRRSLRERIEAFKPDLLHVHFGGITALTCALATRLPLVVTYRGSDLNPNPDRSLPRWLMDVSFSNLAALRASRLICVSPGLAGRLWWRRAHAVVIPSGLDTKVFFPRPRDEARRELGWARDERVVLFNASRGRKIKRQDLALASVEVARSICGEIRFLALDGFVDPKEVPTLMNASDCLLLTSDWEGGPTVVKEALACDLPVVSVDVGDVRERVEGLQQCRIVGRDPQEIGRALAEVLLGRRRSDGSRAVRELAEEKVALRIIDLYRDVLKERGR